MMQATDIHASAHKLYESLGPKALPEAAQKAKSYEAQGLKEEAETWRRIEQALMQIHGPRVS